MRAASGPEPSSCRKASCLQGSLEVLKFNLSVDKPAIVLAPHDLRRSGHVIGQIPRDRFEDVSGRNDAERRTVFIDD